VKNPDAVKVWVPPATAAAVISTFSFAPGFKTTRAMPAPAASLGERKSGVVSAAVALTLWSSLTAVAVIWTCSLAPGFSTASVMPAPAASFGDR
jgi:hypothetical protein